MSKVCAVDVEGVTLNDFRRLLRSIFQMRLSVGMLFSVEKDKVLGSSGRFCPGSAMVCKRSVAT